MFKKIILFPFKLVWGLVKVFLIVFIVAAVMFAFCRLYKFAPSTNQVAFVKEAKFSEDIDYVKEINVAEGEEINILQLTDVQLSDLAMSKCEESFKQIKDLIEKEEPELIVITGDITYGGWVVGYLEEFIKFMDSFKIPWAPVYGNHDHEAFQSVEWMSEQFMKSKYCLLHKGPNNIDGSGNYVVNIKQGNEIVYSCIFMDSLNKDGLINYANMTQSQIEWYSWVVDGLGDVPTMLFFHIPLYEYKDAYENAKNNSFTKDVFFGEKREDICSAVETNGFFDVIKEKESTTHIFVGHDHINSFGAFYEGVWLCYGVKTGIGSYYDKDLTGGQFINIQTDGSVEIEQVIYPSK